MSLVVETTATMTSLGKSGQCREPALAVRRDVVSFVGNTPAARFLPTRPGGLFAILLCCYIVVTLSGCRLAMFERPVSRALAASRKLSREGMAALRDGKSQRAVSILTGAVDTCPTNVEARQGFAEALWQQGQQQEAIAQLEKAWSIDPGEPLVAIQLGELYLREAKPAKSFAFAQAAIDLQPDLASAWLLRAKSREMLNQPEQALADYQHALGLEPENREVLFQIAKSYHRSHQRERSMAALQRLMGMHPPGEIPGDIEYLCGVVCQEQGHHAQAIEHLQLAAASGISTAELSSRLGESAIMVGDFALAKKSANEALRRDPQNVAAAQLMQRLASEQRETLRR